MCTLGDEIKEFNSDTEFDKGTSLAEPIVSSSVVLLKQAFPSLSIFDIKECLLESASKNFFVRDYFKKETSHGTFIYDPEEGPPNLDKIKDQKGMYSWPEEDEISSEPFDPYVYGKGVLDLRSAFIYAKLKIEHPELDKEERRTEMKRLLKNKDTESVIVIQKAFRNHLAKKKL